MIVETGVCLVLLFLLEEFFYVGGELVEVLVDGGWDV